MWVSFSQNPGGFLLFLEGGYSAIAYGRLSYVELYTNHCDVVRVEKIGFYDIMVLLKDACTCT